MQLSAFKTYVTQTFKRTDKDTELVQSYNDSILQVASYIPHGAYKFQSYIPLQTEVEDYPLPSNIMHLLHPVRVLEGSDSTDSGWQLNHLTKADWDFSYANPNRTSPDITGAPADYTVYSRSILVGPLPDATVGDGYLLEMDWTKIPVDQAANPDIPALSDKWREVLKQMTLSRLYAGIGLFNEATYWRSLYEDSMGTPLGLYKQLIDVERQRETLLIGKVNFNAL